MNVQNSENDAAMLLRTVSAGIPAPQGCKKEDLRAEIYSSSDLPETVVAAWRKWQWHPNGNLSYFLELAKSRENLLCPHILAVYHLHDLIAILAGRVEVTDLPIRLGYKTLWSHRLRSLNIPYGGVLGNMDMPVAEVAFRNYRSLLRKGEVDRVWFNSIRESSPLAAVALKESKGWISQGRVPGSIHWTMSLPPTMDEFWARMKAKHRSELRRNSRRLADACGGQVVFRGFRGTGEVQTACDHVESVAATTYLRGMGHGFQSTPETLRRFTLSAERDAFRAYVLYAANKPVAYWIGECEGTIYYPTDTGYDPQFKKYEAGTLALIFAVEELLREGKTKFDFGFGDAGYKQYFGDENWMEQSPAIYAPNLRCLFVGTAHNVAARLTKFSKDILDRVGRTNWVKTKWRGAFRKS